MDNYERAFTPGRVIDGDTITILAVDLGYHVTATGVEYRVARINSPEMHGPNADAGRAAKAYTEDWVTTHGRHGGLSATTTKTDSFGRYLAEITCSQGHNLSDDLLASGNAVPYAPK
jgi:endonuclease YncB( thermonuclease family)